MIALFTRSAQHLASSISLPQDTYVIQQFSDGELYLKINPKHVHHNNIWIIAATIPPAEHIMELLLLLDTLALNGAQSINICFTYFAYARQISIQPGEAAIAPLLCRLFKEFPLKRILILHAHAAHEVEKLLPFAHCIDWNFFYNPAQAYDIIAAPDEGAAEAARIISAQCGKPAVFLHKSRLAHEQVQIDAIDGSVEGKRILLIDDMITTGRTLCAAAEMLKRHGARTIGAAATHGIFSDDALERLNKSPIEKIMITNSLVQKPHHMVKLYNIGSFIKAMIESA